MLISINDNVVSILFDLKVCETSNISLQIYTISANSLLNNINRLVSYPLSTNQSLFVFDINNSSIYETLFIGLYFRRNYIHILLATN